MGKWTRRGFITAGVVGGSALVIGVALRPGHRSPALAKYVAEDGENLVNARVKIDADNQVTVIVPHSEMGQGAQTALSQMVADELDARWEDVTFMEAPAEDAYANYALGKGFILGDTRVPAVLAGSVDGLFLSVAKAMHLQITGGSLSIRATGVYGMRVAGAAAREMLVNAAAEEWGVDASELTTREGRIYHGEKSEPYATFAAAAASVTPPSQPTLKKPEDFTIMGTDKPRLDLPSKVDGSAKFGIDAIVPGMKHAAIRQAPVFGATVASAPDRTDDGLQVVNLENAVAVVADSYWQAKTSLANLEVAWTGTTDDGRSSDTIFSQFEKDIESAERIEDFALGDAATELASAGRVIDRTYRVPYLAHACMEPMNALVHVDGDRCDVWVGTQNPLGFKHEVAEALAIPPENVTVSNHVMGGGFGRRATADYAVQAAKISAAAGAPVKLIWSREEDIQHDHYRPAIVSRFRGALDASGNPLAWENTYVDKHEPAEAPHIPYAIDNQDIAWVDSPTHVPFGAWRSVDHSQHGFFTESFVDELAVEAGKDPLLFRRELLADKPRHLAVLNLAAEKAGWDQPVGKNQGRGIALQESFGTLVAEVIEVTVNDGNVSVDKVTIATDPGFAVAPDGLKAQMESGVIYGLTAALYGEVTIKDGRVEQGNFDSYPMIRMNDAPLIETHIINSMESWGGAGEPGVPGTAPALTNAIYAATGTRVRELPVSRYRFDVDFVEENEV